MHMHGTALGDADHERATRRHRWYTRDAWMGLQYIASTMQRLPLASWNLELAASGLQTRKLHLEAVLSSTAGEYFSHILVWLAGSKKQPRLVRVAIALFYVPYRMPNIVKHTTTAQGFVSVSKITKAV